MLFTVFTVFINVLIGNEVEKNNNNNKNIYDNLEFAI